MQTLLRTFILSVAACGDAQQLVSNTDSTSGSLAVLPAMNEARAGHSATRLLDGRVLIVGGLSSGGTAELFDPVARRFVATGALAQSRAAHTATLLPDGRVLVAGGYSGSWLASTEIYDPTSGRFSAGPTLTEPRSDHLAISLRDGRVLFIGGTSTGYTFLASAELFDPVRLSVSGTGSMRVPRESHVGALLPNGEVLVTGGHTGRQAAIRLHETAEVYDPAVGAFRETVSMTRRRHKHAAGVLADGRVLITGGADERDDRGQYRDAEVYDPATGAFTAIGEMRRARYKHQGTMTLLTDGRVLIAGGAGDPELFNPSTRTFTLVGSSNALAGNFSTATLLASGGVLIAGGYGNGTDARRSAWLFVP
jgi:hypothetical protein